jgi:hypothetical protein
MGTNRAGKTRTGTWAIWSIPEEKRPTSALQQWVRLAQHPENQFHVTPTPRIQAWGDGLKSRVNARAPETTTDYTDFISKYEVPVISHEIGQWCVYPNFDEIAKYKGVLQARNFEIFRDSLKAHHMLDQAHDFLIASGKLQTLLYKETSSRPFGRPDSAASNSSTSTTSRSGHCPRRGARPLLGLEGVCHARGIPPLRLRNGPAGPDGKRYWTTAETFQAEIQVAHFGPTPLKGATIQWTLADASGKVLAKGETEKKDIPLGNGRLGLSLSTPLSVVSARPVCADPRHRRYTLPQQLGSLGLSVAD